MKNPVFLFSFANNSLKPLAQLTDEDHEIHEIFSPLASSGQIQIVRESFVTTKSISSSLKQNDITLLHYSGHANGQSLLFLDQLAHATGIAHSLGRQKNLKFVFLNGCSTFPQVRLLLDQGVPAVLATSVKINDTRAKFFAISFYHSIALGKTIKVAFDQAVGDYITKFGNTEPPKVYRDLLSFKKTEKSSFPWGLYVANDKAFETILVPPIRKEVEKNKNLGKNLDIDAKKGVQIGDSEITDEEFDNKNILKDSKVKTEGTFRIGDG